MRLNLQTGAREVKLQDEDKFRNNLKGSKKGKRYSVNPRDREADNIDFCSTECNDNIMFLTQTHVAF